MEPFIGQIIMFSGTFAPKGWALCDGRLLAIHQHQALFSILGTMYGGDGRTSFALPDLRGRMPMHAGAGTGLTPVDLGEAGLFGIAAAAQPDGGDGARWHEPWPAYLGVNFLIALQGIFPARD